MNELFKSMSNDLNDIMKDNSLQDAFAKIEKFLDESTVSSNEDAWSVMIDRDRKIILIKII